MQPTDDLINIWKMFDICSSKDTYKITLHEERKDSREVTVPSETKSDTTVS